MKYQRVSTGSCETEEQLRLFLRSAPSLDGSVPRSMFRHSYYWKVMTEGRNGPDDAYPGSQAFDDTGGFFELRGDRVYLTDKAKGCITV